jgi:hypothetical protein
MDIIMVSIEKNVYNSEPSYYHNLYKYNDQDLILCEEIDISGGYDDGNRQGKFNINVDPNSYNIFFSVYVNLNSTQSLLNFSIKISNNSNNYYEIAGYHKDGGNGDNGGGYLEQYINDSYNGDRKCYYIAIHKQIGSFKENGNSLIFTNVDTLDNSGEFRITFSNLPDTSYCVLLTPIDLIYNDLGRGTTNNARMYSLQVYNKTQSGFDVKGFYKTVRDGTNAGDVAANLEFQWAVIRKIG